MGILESALVSACIASGGSGNEQMACQKATEAGYRQSGISESADLAEKRTLHMLEREANEAVGKNGTALVSGSFFVAKTLQSRSLVIGLPTFGMCRSVKTELKPQLSMIRFEWDF